MRAIPLLLVLAACVPPGRAAPADVLRRVSASAVLVTTATGSGSGTVILQDEARSLVLTAQHVVGPGRSSVRVVATSAEAPAALSVRSRVLLADPELDLALLETDAKLAVPALPLASEEPGLYDAVYMVGSPMGLTGTAWPGLLSAKLARAGVSLWEITGFTFFGSSGGTLANARGELVGVPIVVATWNGFPVPQIGFAVPLASVRSFLDRAADRGVLGP